MPLHPFASRYEYVGGPVEAEGIFAGKQTSPWLKVSRPSDWYRGPWQHDLTQGHAFRRQPRPLELVDRGAGYIVPPGTGVSGYGSFAAPQAKDLITYVVVALGVWLLLR